MTKRILVIAGPTASGKTALALEIANYFNTSILSFDSRQCYRELNIGVAKPTPEELQQTPHFFINSHSIDDAVNAIVFEKYALQILETEFKKNDTVIVAGGTGLYLNALCHGVDPIPDIPPYVRQELQMQLATNGVEWLQKEILKADDSFTSANDLNNTHRMLRALEVVKYTGHSIRFYQRKGKLSRSFSIEKYGIQTDRKQLYDRINSRVLQMMDSGLLAEVEGLQHQQHLNALQTVGYQEIFVYLKKEISLEKAVENIQQHTRNYAKRQMTWFTKDKEIFWGDAATIFQKIKKQ